MSPLECHAQFKSPTTVSKLLVLGWPALTEVSSCSVLKGRRRHTVKLRLNRPDPLAKLLTLTGDTDA